jgi:branched-chain amino acid transport system substrate-binding protein
VVSKRLLIAASMVATSAIIMAGGAAHATTKGSPITVGASLPLTGPLQAFGTSLQTGYKAAIAEANAKGGVVFGGASHKVNLVVQDNASDGTKASTQAKSLVLDSGAVALLGPATPPLTIPVSQVAEQLHVPLISTITPLKGWLSGKPSSGYQYSWDTFFDETQMTDLQFKAANLVTTNKKVVIFTDTEQDGPIQAALWAQHAKEEGYTVVDHIEFPVGNTNFSSQVAKAKADGADILLAQIIPPDGVALLKELKTQSYAPKLTFLEKAGNTGGYVDITGGLAQGVLEANWYAKGIGLPQEASFISKYTKTAGGINSNLGTIVAGYSITQVLLQAVAKAGGTDAAKLNAAIGKTNGSYPIGKIKFAKDHTSALPMAVTQWNGANQDLVLTPAGKKATAIVTPTAGLKP